MSDLRLHKLKFPKKQVSEMSDEELANYHEPGIEEEGFIETVQNMLTKGVETPEAGISLTPGRMEKAIEKVGSGILSKLRKVLPRKKMLDLGQEIRTNGSVHVMDEAGNMIGTIGEHSSEGRALKQLAKEELERQTSNAPTFTKGIGKGAHKPVMSHQTTDPDLVRKVKQRK